MKKAVLLVVAIAMLVAGVWAAMPRPQADKPVLVVDKFTVKSDAPWPWDLGGLQRKIIQAMQKKFGDKVIVTDKAPAGATRVYTLDAQITQHYTTHEQDPQGNVNTYNDNAVAVYSLTDNTGKKILDNKKKNWTIGSDPSNIPDAASPGPLANQMSTDFVGIVSNAKIF